MGVEVARRRWLLMKSISLEHWESELEQDYQVAMLRCGVVEMYVILTLPYALDNMAMSFQHDAV